MQVRNQVAPFTPPYKGLFEHLSDQVMAQLVHDLTQPAAAGTADGKGPAEPDTPTEAPSFFFSTGNAGCPCASCSIIRSLL